MTEAYIIAGAIIVLVANRIGHWLDKQPGEEGWYEWDMTLWGVFIATLAYLVIDHIAA